MKKSFQWPLPIRFGILFFPTNTNLIQFLLLDDIHASADSKAKLFLIRISDYLKCVHHIASAYQFFFLLHTFTPTKCRTNADTKSKKNMVQLMRNRYYFDQNTN